MIKKWIESNHLEVEWLDEKCFSIGDDLYLCIDHKKGRLFDDQLCLILNNHEAELSEYCKYLCFNFGGKVYYTPKERLEFNSLKYRGRALALTGHPHLGVHGGYELCSGSRVYEDWCTKARFLGTKVLGICEHHTLAGVLKFQLACQSNDIKSIIGESFSVKDPDREYRVKIYAKNEDGWQSLLRLNRIVNVDGRNISTEDIFSCTGVIVVIEELLLDSKTVELYRMLNEETYYQLDPCQYRSDERDIQKLQALKTYINYADQIPPIIVCDSYYLDREDFRVRKLLNQIGSVGFYHQSHDQFFRSREEVIEGLFEMFGTLDQEIVEGLIEFGFDNLESAVDKCEFQIPIGEIKLPKYIMTEKEREIASDNNSLLWTLIEQGLEKKILRGSKGVEEYIKRLEYEVDVITRGGFIDYFLILHDIVAWCKDNDILTGVGRGSAGGCLVAYLLDITKLDPIEYDLLFERFLNEGRIGKSLPDIDEDFTSEDRPRVKRYIESRYGEENVCSIGTYGTFKTSSALRDLCRVKGVPPQVINYHSVMFSESTDDIATVFKEGIQTSILKKFISENVDAVNNMELILGQPKNASIHAAGVLITPSERTIFEWMPVRKTEGLLISEWEGPDLETAGFLKEDILGISQLDKFSDIFKLLRKKGVECPTFENVDYNDPNVYELFKKGWNQDLFHFGSPGLTNYSREVKPENIEDLIAMIALFRPGVMKFGAHEEYVKIKHGKKEVHYDYMLEDITKPTYGILVYQEQIMKTCQVLGGFTLVEGDDIRKALGKKIPEKIKGYRDKFIQGAIERGCPEYEANNIWNRLEVFAGYGFNRSHAAAYAMTGYFCQYLKYYYPMEYWTVSLQYASQDEIPHRINEIRKFGSIRILPPDINKSEKVFVSDIERQEIYWSLGKISQIGDTTVDFIIEERKQNGEFYSLEEFYSRVPKRKVNKRVIEHLILAGCFDGIYRVGGEIGRRQEIMQEFCKLIGDEEKAKEYVTTDNFFWFVKQKEVSGSGYYEFKEVLKESMIPNAPIRYVEPDLILSPDTVDKEVIGIGMLTAIQIRKSKRGEFGQITLDHNNQIIEITLWSETWGRYKEDLNNNKNKIVAVLGKVTVDRYKKHNVIHSTDRSVIEVF